MMGLAEQMLASMSVDDVTEKHSQKEEEHVVVNESRQIVVPNSLKTIAVTKDEDVQTITFDCVRFWDGNDLSTFAIYLNYVLPDGTPATYIPESVVTSDGDAFYHFEWKIKNNITQKSGKISIGITAIKTKVDEGEETVVDKRWSSLPNTDCSIALGIDVSDVPTEEESAGVVAQLTAILEKIQGDLDEWLTDNVVQTTGTSKSKVMSQEAVTIELEKEKNRSNSYVDKKYMELDNLIVRTSKRVENIETGLQEGSFVTDDSVEYQKNVPQNALRYAELKSVGGMTYRDAATNTLKDSPVTAVKSVGANVSDISTPESGYFYDSSGTASGANAGYIRFYVLSVEPNTTYTLSSNLNFFTIWFDDGVDAFLRTSFGAINKGTLTTPANTKRLRISLHNTSGAADTTAFEWFMINKGATAQPYTPYVKHTLPIPTAVQALDGYGQGINATCYNHISWSEGGTKKTFTKMVEEFQFTGNEEAALRGTNAAGNSIYALTIDEFSNNGFLSADFAFSGYVPGASSVLSGNQQDGSIFLLYNENNASRKTIYVISSASTVDAFLSSVIGKSFLYSLYTPEVTDISNLITSDNFIGVEGGGTLTFENEYGYDVPSEVEYQVEV